jgi:PDZ domain-containing protein
MDLSIELIPPGSADGAPRIGISIETAGLAYDLPFPVQITPKKIAGGPSAGLMFTLTVYDLLTEEDLTGGRKIAGTGTIDINGNVGPIGGVQQKVAAAERAGAEYFLCPAQNYADAVAVAKEIEVVQVTTAEEAIEFLKSLPPA